MITGSYGSIGLGIGNNSEECDITVGDRKLHVLNQHVSVLYNFCGTTIKHAVIVENRIIWQNEAYHGKQIGN